MSEVIFEGEKDPTQMRRSSAQKAGLPLGELITPGPQKDKSTTEKIVLGLLGTVLIASVFVVFKTQPKEIVLVNPMDAPLVNPPRP
jgi:hypothetical protein